MKKNIKELKQLDRIEYLLAKQELKWSPYFFNILGAIFWIIYATITMGILFYLAFESWDMLLALSKFWVLFKWIAIGFFVLDILSFYTTYKKGKKLREYFFKK